MSPLQALDASQQRAEALAELLALPDEECLRLKRSIVGRFVGDPNRWERYRYLPMAYVAHQRLNRGDE